MDLKLGIVEGFWTTRAAEQATWVVAQMAPKKAEELLSRIGNMEPSKSSAAAASHISRPDHAEVFAMSRDRSRDAPKSAAELMAELQRDPEFVARTHRQEQQRREAAEDYVKATGPLLKELASVRFAVNAVSDLRQSRANYKAAIPILLKWLPQIADARVREDIVRTLSVPFAKPAAAPVLLEAFRQVDDPTGTGLRWAIANALEVVADNSVIEELVELVQDKKYGKSREMLAAALGNMQSSRAIAVLTGLLADEDLVGHAVIALGKLRASTARQRIEGLLKHPTPWVRKEAKKALASIDKGWA